MSKSDTAILAYKGMAFNTIKDTIGDIYEYNGNSEGSQAARMCVLAEIAGIISLTEAIIGNIEEAKAEGVQQDE